MFGRMDVKVEECPCNGDDKECDACGGTGWMEVCTTCGETMPCTGTKPIFDQTYCSKSNEEE